VNPHTTATVARLRQRLEEVRAAVHESRQRVVVTTHERDEALRDRWSLLREVSAGKRAAEHIESLQEAQESLQQREAELREGLRAVLRDLTALSRYLQP